MTADYHRLHSTAFPGLLECGGQQRVSHGCPIAGRIDGEVVDQASLAAGIVDRRCIHERGDDEAADPPGDLMDERDDMVTLNQALEERDLFLPRSCRLAPESGLIALILGPLPLREIDHGRYVSS